jgi:thiamine-phosphate pyrophosphorylase
MTRSADLPDCCLVTQEPRSGALADRRAFIDTLDATLAGRDLLVQLRAKTLDATDFAVLAREVIACCQGHGAPVILNGAISPADALELGADGIHLSSAALLKLTSRPVPQGALLSAACHTLDDLQHASSIGVDCVTLSPVLPTLSHPGAPVLGWERFAIWSAQARVPVYALGGMTPAHLQTAREHGAQGIASMRGLWRSPDSAV